MINHIQRSDLIILQGQEIHILTTMSTQLFVLLRLCQTHLLVTIIIINMLKRKFAVQSCS